MDAKPTFSPGHCRLISGLTQAVCSVVCRGLGGRASYARFWSGISHVGMRIVPVLLAIAIAWGAMGQEKRPTFEVASIKRSTGDGFPDAKPRRSGGRVTMHDIRVATAVIYAYHLAGGAMTTS